MNWWRHHLTSTSAPFAFCVSETHIRPAAATGKSQDWKLCVCKHAVISLLGLINFPKKVIWAQSSFNNIEASVLQISQPTRFCYTCILTWQSEGMTCPYDKCPLREGNWRPLSLFSFHLNHLKFQTCPGDLFHDAAFEQEIDNLLVRCPLKDKGGDRGCSAVLTLKQMVHHEQNCESRKSFGDQDTDGSFTSRGADQVCWQTKKTVVKKITCI